MNQKTRIKTIKKTLGILLLMACHNSLFADVRTIFSLREATATLETLDENALVVFDVDETLIMAVDRAQRRHPETTISALRKIYFSDQVPDIAQWEHLESIIWKMLGQKLIDAESPTLIKKLQSKGIRIIALTHMHAGAYCAIDSMQEWRYHQLYELGIDLAINNPIDVVFTDLPMGRTSHPVIYKGIFATSRSCTKGQAVAAFIKQLKNRPSRVIFFDDLMEHITTVDREMELLGIPCTAFHYKATELSQEAVDQELAIFQYNHLIKYEQWLSDEQAIALMNKNTMNTSVKVIDQFSPVHREQLHQLYQKMWWANKRTREDVDTILAHSLGIGLVTEDTDTLIGFVRIVSDHFKYAFIFDVIIDEIYRGKGLGKLLMKLATEHPALKQVTVFELHCRPEMAPFYEKFGFQADFGNVKALRFIRKVAD